MRMQNQLIARYYRAARGRLPHGRHGDAVRVSLRPCARDAERYGGGYTQVLEAAHPVRRAQHGIQGCAVLF